MSAVSNEGLSKVSLFMLKYISIWIFLVCLILSCIDTWGRVIYENTFWLNVFGHIIALSGIICVIYSHIRWRKEKTLWDPYQLDLKLMVKLEDEQL